MFDTRFRPRGWPDPAMAEYLVFASTEDLTLLHGDSGKAALLRHVAEVEIGLKLNQPASRMFHAGTEQLICVSPIAGLVDTTAAENSFAAAYLAVRLLGVASGSAPVPVTPWRASSSSIPRDAVPKESPSLKSGPC